MSNQSSQRPFTQRQLRVGELVKQNIGELLIRNEAKIPLINSKLITVTEVRMTPVSYTHLTLPTILRV